MVKEKVVTESGKIITFISTSNKYILDDRAYNTQFTIKHYIRTHLSVVVEFTERGKVYILLGVK